MAWLFLQTKEEEKVKTETRGADPQTVFSEKSIHRQSYALRVIVWGLLGVAFGFPLAANFWRAQFHWLWPSQTGSAVEAGPVTPVRPQPLALRLGFSNQADTQYLEFAPDRPSDWVEFAPGIDQEQFVLLFGLVEGTEATLEFFNGAPDLILKGTSDGTVGRPLAALPDVFFRVKQANKSGRLRISLKEKEGKSPDETNRRGIFLEEIHPASRTSGLQQSAGDGNDGVGQDHNNKADKSPEQGFAAALGIAADKVKGAH
jgi:hypothetical protein